jgi:hypothetical protein
MRAIKTGIDPNNIMNPGTLLPPIYESEIPPAAATIDLQGINDWIVKPESLTSPYHPNPHSEPISTEATDSFLQRSWNEIKRLGENAFHSAKLGSDPPSKTSQPTLKPHPNVAQVWKEQGDGA